MMKTTLEAIKAESPPGSLWSKLITNLGRRHVEITFKQILDSNGIEDAVLCLCTLDYKDYCLFSADVAESVLHIFESEYPDDKRPRNAIKAVRDYHAGLIGKSELNTTAAAAAAASYDAAADAAYAAAYAASYDAAAYAASYDAAAYAAAAHGSWDEIEKLFVKHFCMVNIRKVGSYEIVYYDQQDNRMNEVVTDKSLHETIHQAEGNNDADSFTVSKIVVNSEYNKWSKP